MIARISCMILLVVCYVQAIPLEQMMPIDLNGKVQKCAWIDGTIIKPNFQGPISEIRTVPTYYIILKVVGISEDTRNNLSWYARTKSSLLIMHPITTQKLQDDEILISLDLPHIDSLKTDSRLEIKGYNMQLTKWTCTSHWSELLLDGKPIPKEDRNAEQAAPSNR